MFILFTDLPQFKVVEHEYPFIDLLPIWLISKYQIDFYLSSTRNAKAAKRFLGKILHRMKEYEKPDTINTDQAPSYGHAIRN